MEARIIDCQQYIDFYGYNKDTYEKLSNDFCSCISDYEPKMTGKITVQHWGRCERRIIVKKDYEDNFNKTVDDKMNKMGYVRFKDYNFYEH